MTFKLDELCKQLETRRDLPPVEQWNPALSGKIDIRIDADGRWYHEGELIKRDKLSRLFSTVLRHDAEHGYCLVTPVEKWQIEVEDVPFLFQRVERLEDGRLVFVSNMDDVVVLESPEQWQLRHYQGVLLPYLNVRGDLWGRVSRASYYQLVELADSDDKGVYLSSGAGRFYLE